jgi:hypothetical protein
MLTVYFHVNFEKMPSKENSQHLKKMKFINFFLFLWVNFALLDPDTDPRTPLNPDPKPQH